MLWKYVCFFFTFIFTILTCIFPCRNESTTTVPPPTTTTTTRVNTSTKVIHLPPEVTSMSLFNPTLGMIENFLQSEQRLKDYLGGFTNDLQRYIVETQILFCPFISFCNISIDFFYISQKSCCMPCQCDNCEGTGACCPSILPEEMFNITEVNSTDNNHAYTNLWKFSAAKNKEKTCISEQLTSGPLESDYGFLATADCHRNVDSILQHNCSRLYNKDINFESFLPVSSNSSLEIFRNKYCAVCNGIAEEELVFFKPELVCNGYINILQTEKEITDILFSTNKCSLKFRNKDPRVILSDCNNAVSTCNVTGLWNVYEARLELACHAYESLFRHETYLFRNVFCVMCNGMDPHTINCLTEDDTAFVINRFSFSGLLRLEFDDGFTTSKDDKTVTESSCTRNQIFDALMERCKDLTCPDMRKLQDGDCINIFESINYHFVYTVNIRLKPTSTLRMKDAFDEIYNSIFLLIHGLFDVELDMCKVQMMFKSELKFGRSHSGAIATSSLIYIDLRVKFTKSYLQRPWDIVDNLLKVHGRIINVGNETNSTQQYVAYVHDSNGRLLNIIEELFGSTSFYGDVTQASTVDERITILSEYAMSDTDGLTLLPFSVSMDHCGYVKKEIDVIRYSSCPKVNMSKMDITWADNWEGIAINDLEINNTEFYYIDHDNIMICAEAFERIMGHLQHQRVFDAEIIVSIVSCSLSIICLLFTLVIFCVFPKLRTPLPGKNNMSLITTLLIAQIMLLVGSLSPLERYSLSCKALGLLTHFSWLCSLFWMNVCTYHMFRVLTETKALLTGQGWKRFIRYHVYVVTMAVVLVLANVVSSVASSNGELGYGGKFCYLTSQKRILFTFVIPTCLIIISNLIMFVFVVLRIKRSPSVNKNVKNDHSKLVILAKLSTITGLTWVFGFVYTFTNIKTFSYIFIILNATQGLFIMFAFVINRRVFAMFKDLKIRSRDRIHPQASSNRSTTSRNL